MTGLRFPLKDYLEDPVDEAALHRIAKGIDARAPIGASRKAGPWVLAAAACLSAALALAAHLHYRTNAGPLALADGREFSAVAASTLREVRFSDGSSMSLWPGAYIEPLESTATTFSAALKRGRVDFEVRPGGPRRWTVECGLASVEVVGTSFTCERAPGRLHVEVRHGVVLARGDRVPDRVRRLTAGEVLDLSDPALDSKLSLKSEVPSAEPASTASPESSSSPASSAAGPASKPEAPRTPARAWRELARKGHNAEAYATLGAEGLRNEAKQLGVNDLLALADVARLSGHPAEAVLPLQRILSDFPRDAQAPLAAFALGRLELDSLGHARAAVSAFQKALALGMPRGLREDVLARLVEAYGKSGDAAGARRAAEAYLAEFPNGRHARAVHEWQR